LGLCYEKLGRTEAQNAYERLVREYGDQSDVVATARMRLAALRPAPAEGRGPVVRRLVAGDDADMNNLLMMVPSPDGRQVAYVDLYVGALHLRDLASGEDEVLLPGMPAAWNWSPVWSPDGTRLAFMKSDGTTGAESIEILDLTSRAVTPVPGTEVPGSGGAMAGMTPLAWSRSGRFLLFRFNPNGAGALGVVPVDGGTPRTLTDSVTGGSLSPDDRYVAYAEGPASHTQIFVQAVDGGARYQITDASGGNTDPLWSPDGTAIAYQRTDGIWVVPVAGDGVAGTPQLAYANSDTRVPRAWTRAGGLYFSRVSGVGVPMQLRVDPATGSPRGDAEPLRYHPELTDAFAWSPDGQRIAFLVAAQAGDAEGATISVYATDGSSTSSQRVAEPTERIRGLWWSGDGQEVLFRGIRQGEGTSVQTVRALDPSTGRVRDLFPWSRSRIAFDLSDDGRRVLIFDTEAMPDSSAVGWVVAGTGRTDGRLVVPRWNAEGVRVGRVAQLSPRGDQLLFSRQKDLAATVTGQAGADPGTLWVVGTDGTGLRKVGAAHMIRSAVWDPSSKFIAYTAAVDNENTVMRIVEVATGVQQDVPLPGGTSPDAIVTDWSQDGQLIGIVVPRVRFEYLVLEGLLDAVR
jgi:WD40 repeat protein